MGPKNSFIKKKFKKIVFSPIFGPFKNLTFAVGKRNVVDCCTVPGGELEYWDGPDSLQELALPQPEYSQMFKVC
jgi:hypothetical protein